MFGEQSVEVLIAGAGPVGKLAALNLARKGIAAAIVDSAVWGNTHSYALGLHPQTLRMFEDLELMDNLREAARVIRTIGLWDAEGKRAEVSLAECGSPLGGMAVLRQCDLESLLERALANSGIRVAWSHEISHIAASGREATATINRYEKQSMGYAVAHSELVVTKSWNLHAAYILGADGFNSTVRRAAGLEFPEVRSAEYYATFEFTTDADLGSETRLVLGENTIDILWPLPGNCCRWSFQLPDYQEPYSDREKDRLLLSSGWRRFPVLDESNLRSLIAERAPWFKGSIGEFHWRNIVRFERRFTGSFGKGRLWLAGDAAHLTGPAGMQSMNLGFFEALDFTSAMAAHLRASGPESVLDEVNSRWVQQWRRLHQLDRLAKPQKEADPWVARFAERLVACLPAHGEELTQLARQLRLEI